MNKTFQQTIEKVQKNKKYMKYKGKKAKKKTNEISIFIKNLQRSMEKKKTKQNKKKVGD